MQQFYENLANGSLTKAEALRQAQLSLLQVNEQANGAARASINIIDTRTGETIQPSGNIAHPYYWAPFILIGNSL
jgi:CHAT domain-containing protein